MHENKIRIICNFIKLFGVWKVDVPNFILFKMVTLNQTDSTCVIAPWPHAADCWSFITPSNSLMVITNYTLTGQNFTFWQFTNGFVSPLEAWAFAGNIPLSGAAFGIESWIFKTFEKKLCRWLGSDCQKTTYLDVAPQNPWLRVMRSR
jgi:hypothetical protein